VEVGKDGELAKPLGVAFGLNFDSKEVNLFLIEGNAIFCMVK
jgi:hypothetical protein